MFRSCCWFPRSAQRGIIDEEASLRQFSRCRWGSSGKNPAYLLKVLRWQKLLLCGVRGATNLQDSNCAIDRCETMKLLFRPFADKQNAKKPAWLKWNFLLQGLVSSASSGSGNRWVIAALLFAGLSRLITLGAYPLMDTTEARYAEIAREMLSSGDWITPHLDSTTPFWGKPPLSFWITAASLVVFGVNEFGARLPGVILAAVTVTLTYLLASKLYGKRVGVLSSAILSSTGLFYGLSGTVMPDCTLGLCVTLSMVAVPMVLKSEQSYQRTAWGYVFFVGLALSILAKGLVGAVFVSLTIGIWAILRARWRDLFRALPWVSGTLLCLVVAVPWFILAETRTPGFLRYFFIGEHFLRFLQPSWQGDLYGHPHVEPMGTIWVFWIVSACPWIFVLAGALLWLKRNTDTSGCQVLTEPDTSYLIAWAFMPAFFFTFSRNIMFPYVLPCMPPLAILTACFVERIYGSCAQSERPWFVSHRTIRICLFAVPLVFSVAAITVYPIFFSLRSQKDTIALFHALDRNKNATLLYTDRMPLSADFYARGVAVRDNPGESKVAVERALHDSNQQYYAIESTDRHEFPPDGFVLTEKVAHLGKFEIRREFDPLDANP